MTGKADKRRPLFVTVVLLAAIGAALVVPVLVGARRGEPIPGTIVRAASGETVKITTPISLSASPSITLEEGTVALVGPAAGETRVAAVLRTLVQGGGADIVLDGANLVIDRTAASAQPADAPAAAGAVAPEVLGSIVSALSSFKFRSLALIDASIVIKTVQGTTETLSRVNTEISTDRHGLVNVNGRFDYRGEPIEIDLAFTAPPSKPDAAITVRAKLKGKYIAASFNGRAAPGDRGQITAQNAELSFSDLRGAGRWLGISWPATGPGLGPFSAKGQLKLDDRAVSFENAQFSLDGNAATGALVAAFRPERPSIEGTLAFPTFDIAPYVAPSRPYALALVSDWLGSLKIPGLASPSLLKEIDADIRISAGNVMSGSDRLGRCAASLSVKGGKLYGEIAELELEQGGTGEGQFTVDMTGDDPLYTLRADLDDIDLETISNARLGPAALDGSGDIIVDLNAHGASQAAILQSLAGTLSLEIGEGGRVGIDLDGLPRAASATSASGGWGPAGAGTTVVNQFSAHFTALNGVLTADSVKAVAEGRAVSVTGTIDVDKSALDLLISVAKKPAAATAADPTGTFKVQGPWATPSISPAEPGKAAQTKVSGADPGG